MQPKVQEIGDYVILQTIGVGATGKVKLGEHKTKHTLAAIKIFKKSSFENRPDLQQKIQRETALMRLLDHPHLLKLKEICESPRHIFIILEYAAHGELFDYLMSRRALTVETAMRFFRQIIYGLDYLHSNNICHRDLKPENILLDDNDNIKIADFGFARWMTANTAETSCGSPHYASPEIVKGIPYDGRLSDIWSCGVVLYALLSGRLPFDDPSFRNLVAKVKAGQYRMPDFPPDIKDLISRMLQVDPQKRITIEQIKHHKAFRIDLPKRYTIPTPLPKYTRIDPIDPAQVDPAVMLALKDIGIPEDQIPSLLQQKEFNQAKYFCHILTQKISLDKLPWSVMEEDKPESVDDSAFLIQNPTPIGANFNITQRDPFNRRKSYSESNSMVVYSLIDKTDYVEQEFVMPEGSSNTINDISIQLEIVFGQIQSRLLEKGFDWFYPNDLTLYAHRENVDPLAYYVIQAHYQNDQLFNLTVKVQGDSSRFNEFFNDIENIVNHSSV